MKLNIIFAGTPEFALPCLQGLFEHHHISLVLTQPDRPKGRGQKLQASPVKQWCLDSNIPLLQPITLKNQDMAETIESLHPDVMIVIAYGLILPQAILNIPRLGCINVHASLLPRWRGASPIQQAILNGDKETGVTIMKMDQGMDTGPIMKQSVYPLIDENAEQVQKKLATLGVVPLLDTLKELQENKATLFNQDSSLATYAPKIEKQDAKINWTKSAKEIKNQILAYYPWPIAFTNIAQHPIRILQAKEIAEQHHVIPGTVLEISNKGLKIACGEGCLLVTMLQFPGKKSITR